VATSLNNLGGLYSSQGTYGEAEPLYKRALAILEKALGPDHPNVVAVRNNLQAVKSQRQKEEGARKAGKVRLTMAVVSSQAEGESLLTRVRGGAVFEGKDIGFILPSDVDARFAEAIKDLKVGEVSEVVRTEKGYVVFKRTE